MWLGWPPFRIVAAPAQQTLARCSSCSAGLSCSAGGSPRSPAASPKRYRKLVTPACPEFRRASRRLAAFSPFQDPLLHSLFRLCHSEPACDPSCVSFFGPSPLLSLPLPRWGGGSSTGH